MICYRAIAGRETFIGGWTQCCFWAQQQLEKHPVIKIEKQRAGEKVARIVAELNPDGFRLIRDGRTRRV